MSYFDEDHLVDEAFSTGPRRSFFENVSEGFSLRRQEQEEITSSLAFEGELKDRWLENLREYERVTGERYQTLTGIPLHIGAFRKYYQAEEAARAGQAPDTSEMSPKEIQDLATFRQINEGIRNLNNPGIKPFSVVLDEVNRDAEKLQGRLGEFQERQGVGGFLGGLAGAVVGSFTEREPITFASFGVGGVGKAISTRILTEMAVAGGLVGVTDVIALNPTLKKRGLEPVNPLWDAIIAGAAGGIIRGGLEGVGALAQRGVARGVREAEPLDLRDTQLRQMFERMPESPRARAGLEILEADRAFRAASPYGQSEAGLRRFTGELEDVYAVMSGKPYTAVARADPDALPADFRILEEDVKIVREESPELYARFDEAERRLAEIDERITEIQTGFEKTSVIDAVKLIDENTAVRLQELAARINDPNTPEAVRAGLDIEGRSILERIGEEKIMKAVGVAEIRPRKELQRLRAQRKAAKKQYVALRRGMDQEVAAVRARQLATERAVGKPIKPGEAPIEGSGFDPQRLRPDVIDEMQRTVDETAERLDEVGEATVAGAVEVEGKVRIGDTEFDANMKLTDLDGQEVTARVLAKRLQEDEQLLAAMKECAI
jgi:hypothetical protein